MNNRPNNTLPKIWDNIGIKMRSYPYYIGNTLARYKQREFFRILDKWTRKEFGCILKTDSFEEAYGNDEITGWLTEYSKNVINLDISYEILKQACLRNKGKEFRAVSADILRMPFKSSTFDLIFSSSTYGYLNDIEEGLKEAYRILKPGGTLIISINNKYGFFFRLIARIFVRFNRVPFFLSKPYSAKRFIELLNSVGFRVTQHEYIVHILPFFNSMISFLDAKNSSISMSLLRAIMKLIDKYSVSRSVFKYLTGWFIVFKALKETSELSKNKNN